MCLFVHLCANAIARACLGERLVVNVDERMQDDAGLSGS